MTGSVQRAKPLILIADDDEMERFLQRGCWEPAGFDIVEAKSGAAALQLFAECKPDLVLMPAGPSTTGPLLPLSSVPDNLQRLPHRPEPAAKQTPQ